MEWNMRATLLGLAASTLLLAMVPTANVSAQGVAVEVPGVGVTIGDPDRRDRWRERRYRERETRGYSGRDCRTVTVRSRRADGSVVVRKRTEC
jgi:hypothetical protein